MAKRFTDSEKWKKPWFRKLKPLYKAFWEYLRDNCDHAGIWQVDFELAAYCIGEDVDQAEAMQLFEKQFIPFAGGKRWLIIDFVEYQYGGLVANNNAHISVINILKKNGVWELFVDRNKNQPENPAPCEGLASPSQGYQDKDKDKVKDQDKDQDNNALMKKEFCLALESYSGERRDPETEWTAFQKKFGNEIESIIPALIGGIEKMKAQKTIHSNQTGKPPIWMKFENWLDGRYWTTVYPVATTAKTDSKPSNWFRPVPELPLDQKMDSGEVMELLTSSLKNGGIEI